MLLKLCTCTGAGETGTDESAQILTEKNYLGTYLWRGEDNSQLSVWRGEDISCQCGGEKISVVSVEGRT